MVVFFFVFMWDTFGVKQYAGQLFEFSSLSSAKFPCNYYDYYQRSYNNSMLSYCSKGIITIKF